MAKIDVCVLTAGRFDLLGECLNSIKKAQEITPCNVYIFDNGSPSKELMLFRSVFNQDFITKTKRVSRNTGFARGANSAIGMGSENLVMFVSDDVMIHPNSIASLVNTMQNDEKIGICGMKLLFPIHSTDKSRPAGKVQHIGHSVDLKGNIIHPMMGWSANNPRTCKSGERFSITGAAFMTRRRVFWGVGGFNEIYGTGYFEDVELCIRITQAKYKVWLDANAIGEHHVGATFEKLGNSAMKENQALFTQRNRNYLRWTDWEIR